MWPLGLQIQCEDVIPCAHVEGCRNSVWCFPRSKQTLRNKHKGDGVCKVITNGRMDWDVHGQILLRAMERLLVHTMLIGTSGAHKTK